MSITIKKKKISKIKANKPNISEHQIQAAFFEELLVRYKALYPYIFAIPNGGKRTLRTGYILKKEGVKPGVSDVFCAISNGKYHGLWLEFKKPGGYLTESQKIFFKLMTQQNYMVACVHSADEALNTINKYFSG